jgi:hypothetical protein
MILVFKISEAGDGKPGPSIKGGLHGKYDGK